MPLLKATENETLNFIKKEELGENSLYRRYKIERHRILKKKDSIGVRESKILIDTTILFQSLGNIKK